MEGNVYISPARFIDNSLLYKVMEENDKLREEISRLKCERDLAYIELDKLKASKKRTKRAKNA